MCHVSRITCHLPCITSQVSHVTHFSFYFLLESGGVSLWRVCYQWCLPRLVFKLFFLNLKYTDTKILLISDCSGPFLVIKKSKSMRIKFQRDWNRLECHKLQNSALAAAAPCAHFQKVDVGINKKILT